MFTRVLDVQYLSEHCLEVTFNDGSIKQVDLSGELHGEIFLPLRDMEFFKQGVVNPETNTIEWPNGADFAPEFLHEIGQEVRQAV
jgi:hypothetical protein